MKAIWKVFCENDLRSRRKKGERERILIGSVREEPLVTVRVLLQERLPGANRTTARQLLQEVTEWEPDRSTDTASQESVDALFTQITTKHQFKYS